MAPNLTTTETAPPVPAESPLPTELAALKREAVRKRIDWGRARRSGGGGLATLMPMVQWLLARLNTFRPLRAFQHYNLQHGPLLSAGIGFRMFFSITGLLATGFSIAGLVLRGQPALLDRVISDVAASAPGLLKVDGGEGLVDPQEMLDPGGLGWTAVIAAVVTLVTSLGWIDGLRGGLRAMMGLGPRKLNPVLLKLRDLGTLVLLGLALVISAGASLAFGTAAGWVSEQLRLDPLVARPLTTSIKIAVPLLLGWCTALIMFRIAGGLKLARRALLEGTLLAAAGTGVLQIFSAELLAGAGRNPILAPFAIIIGLLIWFNLVSQVYLLSAAWAAVRETDLRGTPGPATIGWGARRVQPGNTPPAGSAPRPGKTRSAGKTPLRGKDPGKPGRPGTWLRRRGTGRPTPK